jgi:hypothetical protein
LNWGSGGCETGDFRKRIYGYQPMIILGRRVFTRMNFEIGGCHPI